MTSDLVNQSNRQLKLKRRPENGKDAVPDDFEVVDVAVPEPQKGQLLVQAEYLSIDAALRLGLQAGDFLFRVESGDEIPCIGVGRVVASESPKYKVGDYITGELGVQEFAIVEADEATPCNIDLAPAPTWLGGFGVSGLTAYFGLLEPCKPQPGETVVVTGAAGAVGSVVGQIARIKGARAIGICGSEEKCRWLTEELGYDQALNYKDPNFANNLAEATNGKIDIIFDNVGGPVFNETLKNLNMHARIVICGATSQYANDKMEGPSNYLNIGTWRATLFGFVVWDYAERYHEGIDQMAQWVDEGKLKLPNDIQEGEVGDFPRLLGDMFQGGNKGKMIMRLPAAR